jgi:hypothetical protein
MHAAAAATTPRTPTTIERTSKQWKGGQLIGALLVIVGVIMAIASQDSAVHGGVVMLIGFVVFVGARVGAWWHNG